jgi:hypothetical protein
MLDETLAAADEGLRLFPSRANCKKLLKFAKRKQLDGRDQGPAAALNRDAVAQALSRLVSMLYVELGDFGSVQATCEECIRRFPAGCPGRIWCSRGRGS